MENFEKEDVGTSAERLIFRNGIFDGKYLRTGPTKKLQSLITGAKEAFEVGDIVLQNLVNSRIGEEVIDDRHLYEEIKALKDKSQSAAIIYRDLAAIAQYVSNTSLAIELYTEKAHRIFEKLYSILQATYYAEADRMLQESEPTIMTKEEYEGLSQEEIDTYKSGIAVIVHGAEEYTKNKDDELEYLWKDNLIRHWSKTVFEYISGLVKECNDYVEEVHCLCGMIDIISGSFEIPCLKELTKYYMKELDAKSKADSITNVQNIIFEFVEFEDPAMEDELRNALMYGINPSPDVPLKRDIQLVKEVLDRAGAEVFFSTDITTLEDMLRSEI